MYDVIIIGAGPGGMAAAVTAAKEKLNVLVIARSVLQPGIEKEPLDFFDIKGLLEKFYYLVKSRKLELKDKIEVINLEKNIVSFSVEVKNGTVFYGKSIIIAVGISSLDFDHITQKTSDGKIKIDSNQATSVPGIFAVGLVGGKMEDDYLVEIGEGVKAVKFIKNRINTNFT